MVFGFFKKVFGSSKNNIPTPSVAPISQPVAASSPAVDPHSISQPRPAKVDYLALATSFNDFLLDAHTEGTQPPNPSEAFIIDKLNTMLQGHIPDSAVPRLPDIAMALLKELANTNISSEAILSYINRDPALASEVLNLSNSALFRDNSREPIVNLEKALVLLGLNNLKAIVSSALMKRLMNIAPIYFRMFGQHLWQHSLDCGHACRALSKYYALGDENNAYLVGLMHDVGKLAIFGLLTKALGQHLDYNPRGSVFSAIVRDHSHVLSVIIVRKWGLPAFLIMALNEQDDTYASNERSEYGFILSQANMLAEFKTIAEKTVNAQQSLTALAEQYSIPLYLFAAVFPDEYSLLANASELN